ncbi:MAG: hypothetical protein ACKVP5_15530 [Aestuariivirga sp.]
MKFQLAINLERLDDSAVMRDVARHTLEMVQMAEEVATIPKWGRRLHRVLKTLSPELFDYKGLTRYRDTAVQ